MHPSTFLFGVHCHQPVGNLDSVFREAVEKCYQPFFSTLLEYPKIRCTVHVSGTLLEWLEANQPDVISKLKELTRKGQLEWLTGGFYEPILSLIPDRDKVEQIRWMTEYIQENFQVTPRGLWLTERVWDPGLVGPLHEAGVEYLVVDDMHFLATGFSENDLQGYFLTEENGVRMNIFPIHKPLRYLVPFRQISDVEQYFRKLSETPGGVGILLDDCEKFGMWPGTYSWVHEQGWLRQFFEFISQSSMVTTGTPGAYMDENLPRGRAYLGSASYSEMHDWALPAGGQHEIADIRSRLSQTPYSESPFVRGGHFKNFLVKYDESNLMHKKMLWVSNKISAVSEPPLVGSITEERKKKIREAKRALFRGQCNCAYWHGIFGGLHINFLRHAVYTELLRAEQIADNLKHAKPHYLDLAVTDYDFDGRDEMVISTPTISAGISPSQGGSLFEFSYRPHQFNVQNVLRNIPEGYHASSAESHGNASGGVASIHEMGRDLAPELEKLLRYDSIPLRSLREIALPGDATFEAWTSGSQKFLDDFRSIEYIPHVERKSGETRVILVGAGMMFQVRKVIIFSPQFPKLEVEYEVSLQGNEPVECLFGSEWNITLIDGHNPHKFYEASGIPAESCFLDSTGVSESKEFRLVDGTLGFRLSFDFPVPTRTWRGPLFTVSQSEKGLEKSYQGSALLFHWPVAMQSGEVWRGKFEVSFQEED